MSKLSKLLGKTRQIEIDGINFDLKPLAVEDLSVFIVEENATEEQKMKVGEDLIMKSVTDENGEAPTREEVKKLPVSIMKELAEEIQDLNGLKEDGAVTRIKRRIAERTK